MKFAISTTTRLHRANARNLAVILLAACTMTAALPPPPASINPSMTTESTTDSFENPQHSPLGSTASSCSFLFSSSSTTSSTTSVMPVPEPPPSPPGTPPIFPPPSPPPTPPPDVAGENRISHHAEKTHRLPHQTNILIMPSESSETPWELENPVPSPTSLHREQDSKGSSEMVGNTPNHDANVPAAASTSGSVPDFNWAKTPLHDVDRLLDEPNMQSKAVQNVRQLLVPTVTALDYSVPLSAEETGDLAAISNLLAAISETVSLSKVMPSAAVTAMATATACTSTLIQFAHINMMGAGYRPNSASHSHGDKDSEARFDPVQGRTTTTYASTATVTEFVKCGGCTDLAILQLGGPGPVVVPPLTPMWDATVTQPVETLTVTACA